MSKKNRNLPIRMSAAVAALSLLAAGCGGGGEVAEAEDELSEMLDEMADAAEEAEQNAGDSTDSGSEGESIEVLPPEFHLPEPADAPSGFSRLPAVCETEDRSGAWITYAVPEGWEATSRSGGGSGSALSTSLELGFDLPDGGRVSVELDPESRMPDGTILNSSGEEFQSFDYDYSIGDDSTTITYDPMETVAVGDQEVEIWKAPRDQAPDFLSTTEHKARFEVASLPNPAPGDDDGYMPASFVMTVAHDPDEVELEDGTVTNLVESLALPGCTVNEIQLAQEVRFEEDFNGDGEVTTSEDMLEELQDQLDELTEDTSG